jgi:hypothetical protein
MIPILCFGFAAGVSMHQANRLHKLDQEWRQVGKQLAAMDSLTVVAGAKPRLVRYPTVEQSANEQPLFLNILRAYALETHIKVTRWANVSSVANQASTSSTNATNAEKPPAGMPPDVTPIASTVEVSGTYNDIRRFLYRLMRSPRVLSLSDIRWMRDDKWPETHLHFTLTRYVAPLGKASLRDVEASAKLRDPMALSQPKPPVSALPAPMNARPGVPSAAAPPKRL